ncbi:MAG: hypothetical protein ACXW2I_18245 [Burkholderiales bacterium]
MLWFSLTPLAVSALLIAAHFFRSGSYVLAAAGLLFPALLAIRTPLALRLVQLLLLACAAEWVRTLASIAVDRQALGQPWVRMAAILATIAALNVLAAYLLGARRRQLIRQPVSRS